MQFNKYYKTYITYFVATFAFPAFSLGIQDQTFFFFLHLQRLNRPQNPTTEHNTSHVSATAGETRPFHVRS